MTLGAGVFRINWWCVSMLSLKKCLLPALVTQEPHKRHSWRGRFSLTHHCTAWRASKCVCWAQMGRQVGLSQHCPNPTELVHICRGKKPYIRMKSQSSKNIIRIKRWPAKFGTTRFVSMRLSWWCEMISSQLHTGILNKPTVHFSFLNSWQCQLGGE